MAEKITNTHAFICSGLQKFTIIGLLSTIHNIVLFCACNRQMNCPASLPAYLEAVFILKTICIDDLLVFFKHFWHTEVPLKHTIVKSHVCRRKWGIIHLQQTIQAIISINLLSKNPSLPCEAYSKFFLF